MIESVEDKNADALPSLPLQWQAHATRPRDEVHLV